MSKYVTLVKWSQDPMSSEEYQQVLAYIHQQTAGNGLPAKYNGLTARSWIDESAANAFCDFAKALQQNQQTPTTATVYTVD